LIPPRYAIQAMLDAVTDPAVEISVRIAADEVGGDAREGYETAIRRDGRRAGTAVALCAVRRDTHPLSHASQPVVDENIRRPVRIAADEVGGGAREGYETTIRRDGRPDGGVIALGAVQGNSRRGGRLLGGSDLAGPEEHPAARHHEAAAIDDRRGIRGDRRAVARQFAPAQAEDP